MNVPSDASNEVLGEFPENISPDSHNALMGCMYCQEICPVNKQIEDKLGRLEDITEEETKAILSDQPDKKLMESISKKSRGFYAASAEDYYPVLKRNVEVLISTN